MSPSVFVRNVSGERCGSSSITSHAAPLRVFFRASDDLSYSVGGGWLGYSATWGSTDRRTFLDKVLEPVPDDVSAICIAVSEPFHIPKTLERRVDNVDVEHYPPPNKQANFVNKAGPCMERLLDSDL